MQLHTQSATHSSTYQCPTPTPPTTTPRWELIGTFTLVAVVYAVAVGEPSFGTAAPLAIGLTVFATDITGEWVIPAHPSKVLGTPRRG